METQTLTLKITLHTMETQTPTLEITLLTMETQTRTRATTLHSMEQCWNRLGGARRCLLGLTKNGNNTHKYYSNHIKYHLIHHIVLIT